MVKMWKEILEQPAALEKCRESSAKLISEIVDVIKSRDINSVLIAGRGTSDHAGIYGKYIMECELGIPVALAAPSVFTVYKKGLKLQNTLVIGISQSGKALDVLEVLKNAKESDAVTISITNDEASPMAKEAKYHLFCNVGVEESVAATKTFTAEMYLIAQLVAEWSGNADMKKELSEIPANISKIFEASEHIKNSAYTYRLASECFVLSRGMNYPIALETALKLQETTYVRARAYATSDFYHGPFAMIEKNMPVVVIAPEGPALADIRQMIERLKENMVELVIYSNNKEILAMGNSSFEIPATSNDMITPFYNIVISQMFACQLALAKGLNPDAPRGLNKVTITK